MVNNYQPVIGLEIHIELKTKSKMFCQCSADYFGKEPNTNTCPVCLALPGALPVPNKKAIEWTVLLGKALNCQISSISKFERKHYFYPDLPKGYQISQQDLPFCINGYYELLDKNLQVFKKIRINRVHLEEDTGKLIHQNKQTFIDFNRSGVPLIEIVTEPDFNNSDDVKKFLEELHVLIRYLDISDADMEKGSMRLEPNISIMKIKDNKKTQLPNYKVEIKNINSFRFVKQAIDYEIKRQKELLEEGVTPKQETRGFDSEKGITFSQRVKEEAEDYRYFPEPDIPPIKIDSLWLNNILKTLPELPQEKLKRYVNEFNLKYQDAYILTRDKDLTIFYEEVIEKLKTKKTQLKINNVNQTIANLIINKKISLKISSDEFITKALNLLTPKQVDKNFLNQIINKVIQINKKAVDDYKKGKENALMFLVGQVMKEMKGKAEAKEVKEIIKKVID